MKRLSFVPLALLLLTLAACGKKEAAASGNSGTAVAAVAPPAGTAWSDKVEQTDSGFRMGNPDAPIKVIEYGSYTCPHCAAFAAESHDALVKDYVDTGRVSYEFRSMLRNSFDVAASLIAGCGGAQTFFPMNEAIFTNQDAMVKQLQTYSDSAFQSASASPPDQRFVRLAQMGNLIEFAKQHGLPEDKARACLADPAAAQKLVKVSDDVMAKFPEFPGTPSFLLNGALLDNTATWSALETRLRDAGA